ncbi:MAG: hypothetical protein ACRDPW_00965 [Mycobacteriales bacterium]
MEKSQLEELRDYYDSTDVSAHMQDAEWVENTIDPDEIMVSYAIRLPRPVINRIREIADAAGVPTTTLMRQWITDRLQANPKETVISVSELTHFLAAHAHPTGV